MRTQTTMIYLFAVVAGDFKIYWLKQYKS